MPERTLSDERRRALIIAALSHASSFANLAREYGVSRSYVYQLRDEAIRDADEEGAFWDKVRKMARDDGGMG